MVNGSRVNQEHNAGHAQRQVTMASGKKFSRDLLWPWFWGPWLLVMVFWACSLLPWRFQMMLGKWAGNLYRRFGVRARHVTSVNLALCFRDRSSEERKQLLTRAFISAGAGIFEANCGWWVPDHGLPACAITGIEHLQKALEQKNGVILCSAHFLTWELVGRHLNRYYPVDVVYLPQKHPLLDWISTKRRGRYYRNMIRSDDFRQMVQSLKENRLLWYTADIDPGRRRKGVFVPFFGVPAYSTTALARLARLSRACVIPAFPFRRDDGSGYDLTISPPLEGFPSNDVIQDTKRVNEVIEHAVKQCPEQYLWQYKRFKTRPSGEMRVYGK